MLPVPRSRFQCLLWPLAGLRFRHFSQVACLICSRTVLVSFLLSRLKSLPAQAQFFLQPFFIAQFLLQLRSVLLAEEYPATLGRQRCVWVLPFWLGFLQWSRWSVVERAACLMGRAVQESTACLAL